MLRDESLLPHGWAVSKQLEFYASSRAPLQQRSKQNRGLQINIAVLSVWSPSCVSGSLIGSLSDPAEQPHHPHPTTAPHSPCTLHNPAGAVLEHVSNRLRVPRFCRSQRSGRVNLAARPASPDDVQVHSKAAAGLGCVRDAGFLMTAQQQPPLLRQTYACASLLSR